MAREMAVLRSRCRRRLLRDIKGLEIGVGAATMPLRSRADRRAKEFKVIRRVDDEDCKEAGRALAVLH
jgi:hypothetical protein